MRLVFWVLPPSFRFYLILAGLNLLKSSLDLNLRFGYVIFCLKFILIRYFQFSLLRLKCFWLQSFVLILIFLDFLLDLLPLRRIDNNHLQPFLSQKEFIIAFHHQGPRLIALFLSQNGLHTFLLLLQDAFQLKVLLIQALNLIFPFTLNSSHLLPHRFHLSLHFNELIITVLNVFRDCCFRHLFPIMIFEDLSLQLSYFEFNFSALLFGPLIIFESFVGLLVQWRCKLQTFLLHFLPAFQNFFFFHQFFKFLPQARQLILRILNLIDLMIHSQIFQSFHFAFQFVDILQLAFHLRSEFSFQFFVHFSKFDIIFDSFGDDEIDMLLQSKDLC